MYKCINGFTKEKIKETILKNNKNFPSIEDGINCKYRSDNGNMCFVGCFIPEKEYSPTMEGTPIAYLLGLFANLNKYMPLPNSALIDLQILHDGYSEYNMKSLHETMIDWVDANVEDA